MKSERDTRRVRYLAHASCASLAAAFGLAGHSLAQPDAGAPPPDTIVAPPPPPDPSAGEDVIIVTGTRIPRKDVASASPVATFDRDEITKFGATALEDFLNTLPQVKPDFGRTSNNPGNGTASVDLRGLGSGRTLVLVNGRRVAPTGTGSAIDVNAIPAAMIQSVEVVSGGTSAVYGSDAVTGAVNFITRKDFTGLEASAQADVFGAGDGAVYNGSLAGGVNFADGRGHVAVFGDFLKRNAVLQGDREFTATVFSDSTGVLLPAGSSSVPAGRTIGGGPSLLFNPDGSVRPFTIADTYNFAPANYLQTPLERWSAGLFSEFEAAPDFELFAELMFSRPTSGQQLAAPLSTFRAPLVIDSAFFAPSARPTLRTRYDPDNDGIGFANISKRFEDTGPRIVNSERNYYRGVLGFRAGLGGSWSLDGHYSYGRNDSAERLDNAVSLSRVLQGLLINPATGACVDPSNGCVAVNIFGAGNISQAAGDFIRVDGLANEYSSVQHNAALIATGDLFTWSQGTVQASGGVEFRRNAASAQADPALATGDALGFNSFAGAEGAINVYEAFGELLVPILADQPFAERLELEFGGRHSQYSSAGGVWTWKAGGQWIPVENLRFSGMWQRAVRAPNVDELFEVPVRNFGSIGNQDFCAAVNDPAGAGLADVCIAQGMSPAAIGVYNPPPGLNTIVYDTISGGNPRLEPETASSITAGVDYAFDLPVDLRVGVDYFSIALTGAIATADPFDICPLVGDPSDPICTAIVRAPTGEPLQSFDAPQNVAVARARGLDLTLDFAADAPRFLQLGEDARFAIRSAATVYFEFGQQQSQGSPFLDCTGSYGLACAVGAGAGVTFPKAQVSSAFSLAKGPFTGSLRWRWISGGEPIAPVVAALAGQPPPLFAIDAIPAEHYVDLSGALELFDGVSLRAGVDNVFRSEAPLLGSAQTQANTDPSRYDVFGRRFFIGVDVAFGGD